MRRGRNRFRIKSGMTKGVGSHHMPNFFAPTRICAKRPPMTDSTSAPEQRDYRDTVFLPKTDFPMKAGLPQKEPLILAKWVEGNLEGQIRESRKGRDQFILHDGPPYANGDMHIGHALNHILKDMVVRTQTLKGKDAPYVPGWDCHGRRARP